MSKLKIYGVAGSRAFRTLWMAKELGLDYEHVPTGFSNGDVKKPEFLAINPNGHVPAIQDGDLSLWESMAINLYLARKHGGPLAPKTVEDEGRALQWSFWAVTEAEGRVLTFAQNRSWRPADQRDEAAAVKAEKDFAGPLKVLDQALSKTPYLLGQDFTVADLNVASVLSWAKMGKMDLSGAPHVDAWLKKCLDRQASKDVRAMMKA